MQQALTAFDTLSQPTRLQALRLLVRAGPAGMPAGALSEALETPHNTLSFHLSHMAGAGVVTSRREGRSIIYAANFALMGELVRFLVSDCCGTDTARVREDKKRACSIIELSHCCQPNERKPS